MKEENKPAIVLDEMCVNQQNYSTSLIVASDVRRHSLELFGEDDGEESHIGEWVPNGKKLLIISVYAPQELTEKKTLWDYLTNVIDNWNGEVVIMDDFNEVPAGLKEVELENNVTREEIKRAVWDCGVDKSPGPNGFTFGSYRRYWSFMEKDVEEAIFYFFQYGIGRSAKKRGNSSFIALILKMHDAKMMSYFIGVKEEETDYVFLRWCDWIQSCLRSYRGLVIVNGSPTREFQFHKGLKQGDPLSPFLFILIMESRHILVQRVVDAGMFRGAKVGGLMSRVQSWNEIVDNLVSHLS
ncbi:RNA-directed DNA polymerase, eukaryota, reverse transcriptase zinc-binding domain protein [Tanacetum coccineum]